jgi:predicted glycoside hydrolase/deacetylase ChbG (UPF0249 family)
MSEGVSAGIEELAALGHISATSAIVTGPLWRALSQRVSRLSQHAAVGLHLNLTWGTPLASMPALAPRGALPGIGTMLRLSLLRQMPTQEIEAEVVRQLHAFAEIAGRPPDFIDGHEHMHALPQVRGAVLAGLARFDPKLRTVLRTPSDAVRAILARGIAVPKAVFLRSLASGFSKLAHEAGHQTNDSFAGVSTFSTASPYLGELTRFFIEPSVRHLVMCHPGHAETKRIDDDPIALRRLEEFSALKSATWLPDRIWHPSAPHSPLWSA